MLWRGRSRSGAIGAVTWLPMLPIAGVALSAAVAFVAGRGPNADGRTTIVFAAAAVVCAAFAVGGWRQSSRDGHSFVVRCWRGRSEATFTEPELVVLTEQRGKLATTVLTVVDCAATTSNPRVVVARFPPTFAGVTVRRARRAAAALAVPHDEAATRAWLGRRRSTRAAATSATRR